MHARRFVAEGAQLDQVEFQPPTQAMEITAVASMIRNCHAVMWILCITASLPGLSPPIPVAIPYTV